MASTPIIVEDVAEAEELNPVLTRSNTRGKAKSKRKTASAPIIVEDVLEVSKEVHDDKEQYSNSKNWSSDDFVNLACAWSQVSQNFTTTNNQKAATFWLKVRDQFNSFYIDQSMWRSYNNVNCTYKVRLNKKCSIFRGIIQDLESRHHTGIGTDDFVLGFRLGRNVIRTEEDYADVNWDELGFGLMPRDYMYVMKYSQDEKFSCGELNRYGNIELTLSSGVLNYGQVPPPGKGSLYIRPLFIGTGAILGLTPAPNYIFLIYASLVGNYFKVEFPIYFPRISLSLVLKINANNVKSSKKKKKAKLHHIMKKQQRRSFEQLTPSNYLPLPQFVKLNMKLVVMLNWFATLVETTLKFSMAIVLLFRLFSTLFKLFHRYGFGCNVVVGGIAVGFCCIGNGAITGFAGQVGREYRAGGIGNVEQASTRPGHAEISDDEVTETDADQSPQSSGRGGDGDGQGDVGGSRHASFGLGKEASEILRFKRKFGIPKDVRLEEYAYEIDDQCSSRVNSTKVGYRYLARFAKRSFFYEMVSTGGKYSDERLLVTGNYEFDVNVPGEPLKRKAFHLALKEVDRTSRVNERLYNLRKGYTGRIDELAADQEGLSVLFEEAGLKWLRATGSVVSLIDGKMSVENKRSSNVGLPLENQSLAGYFTDTNSELEALCNVPSRKAPKKRVAPTEAVVDLQDPKRPSRKKDSVDGQKLVFQSSVAKPPLTSASGTSKKIGNVLKKKSADDSDPKYVVQSEVEIVKILDSVAVGSTLLGDRLDDCMVNLDSLMSFFGEGQSSLKKVKNLSCLPRLMNLVPNMNTSCMKLLQIKEIIAEARPCIMGAGDIANQLKGYQILEKDLTEEKERLIKEKEKLNLTLNRYKVDAEKSKKAAMAVVTKEKDEEITKLKEASEVDRKAAIEAANEECNNALKNLLQDYLGKFINLRKQFDGDYEDENLEEPMLTVPAGVEAEVLFDLVDNIAIEGTGSDLPI
ncbi:hypothetical protein GIB67_039438, partial [Kingdonia uniflora]